MILQVLIISVPKAEKLSKIPINMMMAVQEVRAGIIFEETFKYS